MFVAHSRRRLIAACGLAALSVVLLGLRVLWQIERPLHFDTVKTVIYVRDAALLGPATICGIGAVWFANPWSPSWLRHPSRNTVALIAVIAFVGTSAVAHWILLGVPAIVDEAAYLWQAQLLVEGRISGDVGPAPMSTVIQYLGDVSGRRISVFFPGSAVALAVGYALGVVNFINPLLIALCTVMTYWAGRRLFDARVGVIAAIFFAISPFTLFQGASFFGHAWTALFLVPAVTFALAPRHRWEPTAIGVLVAATLFARPVSASVCALFVAALWISEALRNRALRPFALRAVGAIAGGLLPLALFCAYNRALTGSWLETAHRHLLPNETAELGARSIKNFLLNLAGLAVDFNGLVLFGLPLVVAALWSRSRTAGLIVIYATVHLGAYSLYYNHGISYGPRYLFEATPLLLATAAYGVTRIPRLEDRTGWLLVLVTLVTVAGVVPGRAQVFHSRAEYLDLSSVISAYENTPTLVLISDGPYKFPDPMYPALVYNGPSPGSKPLVFVRDSPEDRCAIAKEFAGRDLLLLASDVRAAGREALEALSPLALCTS